jgi:CubicO group peptidase (beta-lactamase class C family)
MYSCTKPITCAAAMQLVEQGKLLLDAPVADYLPAYRDTFLLKDGKPVPTEKVMTVRHLFTMSAGLSYDRDTEPLRQLIRENPGAGTVEVVSAFPKAPLQFEPGERFLYSLCHDVLAAVVEVVSGQRFSEYLKTHIFDPLGMARIGFDLPKSEEPHLVAQYVCPKPGVPYAPMAGNGDFRITGAYESGGAGCVSTVEDYSRFLEGWRTDAILKPETLALMTTNQLGDNVDKSGFGLSARGYGYGLGLRCPVDTTRVTNFGWGGAAAAWLMCDKVNDLTLYYAQHVLGSPNQDMRNDMGPIVAKAFA